MRVSDDYKMAAKLCLEVLDRISDNFDFSKENTEPLIRTTMNNLASKIVNKCYRQFAEMAVGAIISVAYIKRKDIDFELKKVDIRRKIRQMIKKL